MIMLVISFMASNSLPLTVSFLKLLYPQAKAFARLLQMGNGYINIPEEITQLMVRDGLPTWSEFYEKPQVMKSLVAYALIGSKNAKEFSEYVSDLSDKKRHQINRIALRIAYRAEKSGQLEAIEPIHVVDEVTFNRWYRRLSEQQKIEYESDLYLYLYALIPNYINVIALMTHGASMCDLVDRAKNGDEKAFLNAVQTDKSVLVSIPFFRKKFEQASLGKNPELLKKIGTKIGERPIAGRIKHKTLMIILASLDEEGFFELPYAEKYDILAEIGVYGPKHNQYDIHSLRKVITNYCKRTGRENLN